LKEATMTLANTSNFPKHAAPAAPVDVLIVGAGPTGLTLAVALASSGLRIVVIDRQAEGANTSRAAVVHARTLEVLEPLGVTASLTARGLKAKRFALRDGDRVLMSISFDTLPTRYPYTLMLSQAETEAVLLQKLHELGGEVLRPRALAHLTQDDTCVTATLDDGSRLQARYVVGADGMHSTVREMAGIAFDGGTYGESFMLADVRLNGGVPSEEVALYVSPAGMAVLAPLPDGLHRVVAVVDDAPEQPSAQDVESLLRARGPQANPTRVNQVVWGTRFRVHHRIARSYRRGKVLLAGDAAHVHSPAGGQGMNVGILDAVALAEALERAVAGDESALDAYGAQRRPIAQQVVALADRLTRVATVPPGWRALRNLVVTALSKLPRVRRQLAWRLSGLVYR
jgi:2-polyprenyl-6-methoxyphenol hydroxylase-like FAD-dependent oxidoreductase